jgi:hypothetical protein
MTNKITILKTNNQPDGSFSISGVFWLNAPSNLIILSPLFKSQVPNTTADQLSLLKNGIIVEQSFNTGLYISGTTLDDIKTDLQSLYAEAQNNLNNSAPNSNGFIGAIFDGYTWSVSNEPLNIQPQLVIETNRPKDPDGIPLTTLQPRTGDEVIYVSHNLCDKVTWFGDSIRIVDETLTNIDNLQFTSSHINWIDMVSGRMFDDDGLIDDQKLFNPSDPHGYQVIIKVDGYEKIVRGAFEESGGDYEIYFDDGYVKFFEPQTGVVTASYSYENGSTFYVKPLDGTLLSIEAAEADFSDDIGFKDSIEYSVWGFVDVFAPQYLQSNGGPYPSGTKIPLKSNKYKRYTQILGEAMGSYPALAPNGVLDIHKVLPSKEFRRQSRGSLRSIQSVPFRYATTRNLDSRYGMELRLKLSNDRVFGGETGTLTFYCTSKKV